MLPPMDEFCRHCGHPLGANDEFCGSCGQPAHAEPAVTAEPQGPPPVEDPFLTDGSVQVSTPGPTTPSETAQIRAAAAKSGSSRPAHARTAGGSSRAPTIIVGAVIVVALLFGVYFLIFAPKNATPVSPTAAPTTGAPKPSETPSDTPKPADLKPADARLRGNMQLDMTATSTDVDGLKGETTHFVYHFDPRCAEGPCDVVSANPRVILLRSGASYEGESTGSSGSTCNGEPISSYIKITLRVQDAAMREGKWTATKVIGKLNQNISQSASSQSTCDPAQATYKIHGRTTSKPVSSDGGVPAIHLTAYPNLASPADASNYFLDAWRHDDRGAAGWAGTDTALNFMFSQSQKPYKVGCAGLKYLNGTNCGLYLHHSDLPYIIFNLRQGTDPAWYVKDAYINAD